MRRKFNTEKREQPLPPTKIMGTHLIINNILTIMAIINSHRSLMAIIVSKAITSSHRNLMAIIISKVITNSLMVINIPMVGINNHRKSLKNLFIKNGGFGYWLLF